ncbi:MAG: carboxypeptidase regulatory-like domain-containing protein [Acidobacteriaceae bacterium]
MKARILLLVLIVTLATVALAQSDRATVTGEVKDPSGAAVPGATVTITNDNTNLQTTTQTNQLGLYSLVNLPIGNYHIVFTKDGFASFERRGLALLIGQVVEINVSLKLGSAQEVVTVVEEAPILQTQTSSLSTNITNNVVNELPLNVFGGRNLSNFMFAYVPGVEGGDYDSHINGSLSKTKEVMIDGISAVSQLGGYISESQPPLEAVEEFEVSSTGLRGDEGRSGGGVFRYNLKSGTNQWHGSGIFFMHNEALNANNWGNKFTKPICVFQAQGDPYQTKVCSQLYDRPQDRLYDYGGSFGGPIRKDKTFFFFGYEKYMYSNYGVGSLNQTVPIPAFLNGDFSSLLDTSTVLGTDGAGHTIYKGAIFDPQTGNVFVGNQIPTSRFSPISQKIVDIYKQQYAPIAPGFTNNNAMVMNNSPWYHITGISIKLDHVLTQSQHLSGSFYWSSNPRMLADQGGLWAPGSTNGGPFANTYDHHVNGPSIRLSHTWTINPRMVNVAAAALNRFYNPSISTSASGDWSKTLGIGDFGAGNFPVIKFQGINDDQWRAPGDPLLKDTHITETSIGSHFNDFYAANTYVYKDNLTWSMGRHTWNFGAEFRAQQFNSHGDSGVPQITFDPAQTAGGHGSDAGFGFASFLLGEANQMQVSVPNNTYGRRKSFSAYASDDIKLNSKLTLNADLRWDFNGKYHEKYGHWSNFNPTIMNTAVNLPGALEFAKNGSDSFERNQYYHNFSGNLGAAFQLTPRTVVRGAFSVYYVPLNLNTWGAIPYGFNPGFVGTNQHLQPFNWDNGYPGTLTTPTKDPNYLNWGMVAIDPRSLELGNTQQWTVSVQRELSRDTRFEASFIQSHSYHLQSGYLRGNQPVLSDYTAAVQQGKADGCWPWCWTTKEGWGGFTWMGITPFPQVASTWGPLFYVGSPDGNADYKSLQLSVTKRTSHGLSLQASYNLSQAHGDTDTSFSELWWTGPLQDIYNLNAERNTLASFDSTHIVKGYVLYELPFGKDKMMFGNAGSGLNALVGGWTISAAFHYNTGTPMWMRANGDWYPTYGIISNVYANVVSGCQFNVNSGAGVGGQYFNPACITNPVYGQFGTAPGYLGTPRNPGFASEDMGLNKSFAFGPEGRFRLTARFQLFNVFNRHALGGPNTSIGSTVPDPYNPANQLPGFGHVTWQNVYGNLGPRIGQFGVRFTF